MHPPHLLYVSQSGVHLTGDCSISSNNFPNACDDVIFTINIKTLIAIIIYHLVSFIVLNVIGYGSYGVGLLFKILTHSVIMTVFYTLLSYLIYKKIKVDKIR